MTRLQELASELLCLHGCGPHMRGSAEVRVTGKHCSWQKSVHFYLSFDIYSFIVCVHGICGSRFSPFSCGF